MSTIELAHHLETLRARLLVLRRRAAGADEALQQLLDEALDVTGALATESGAAAGGEECFRDIFDHSPVGIALTDTEGHFLHANEAFCQIVAHSQEELLHGSLNFLEFARRDDAGDDCCEMNKLFAGELPALFIEKRFFRRNGEDLWLRVTGTVRRDWQGHPIQIVGLVENITDRKRAEEALQRERAFLRQVIGAAPSMIFVKDWEGRFVLVNEPLAHAYGSSVEEIVGRTDADFNPHTDEVAHFLSNDREVMTTRQSKWIREECVTHADGRAHWYSTFKVPLVNPDGTCDKLLGVASDITERKEAEEALRKAKEANEATVAQLDAVIESITDALIIGDLDGNILRLNPAALALHGFHGVQDARMHINEYPDLLEVWDMQGRPQPPDTWPMALAARGETFTGMELRVRRRDTGREFIGSYSGTPVRDREGRHILSIITIRDITVQKHAEESMKQSEERFRTLADAMPQVVWTARPDGVIDYANLRWRKYVGLSEGTREGGQWVHWLHPEDIVDAQKAWRDMVLSGRPSNFECRFRLHDGTYRWHLVRTVPTHDAAGRVTKWYCTATDIDDLKRAQGQLEQFADELRRSNEDLEQFAYIVSHDLQGPLRVVGSYAQLLQERAGAQLCDEGRIYLSVIEDSARRMGRLVRDLLAYSRVGTHGRKPDRVDMEKVLQEALSDQQAAIDESAAVITHDPLPIVWADETQMKQLFTNLIGNAIKFRRKEEPPRIHVAVLRAGRFWQFSVRDNGIGIAPQYHSRIFQIFERLHTEEEYPGTGLGLAICKKIVERHGGEVSVESQEGHGTTFHVTIPDREAQPE